MYAVARITTGPGRDAMVCELPIDPAKRPVILEGPFEDLAQAQSAMLAMVAKDVPRLFQRD